jgi:hypothetical protein
VTETGGFKEYVRVCTTDLCNDWDGVSSGPIGGSGGDGGGEGGGSGSGGSEGGKFFSKSVEGLHTFRRMNYSFLG